MGWIELEESEVAPHNMSETIAECISTLAQKRKDLWNTTETWGEVNTVHAKEQANLRNFTFKTYDCLDVIILCFTLYKSQTESTK